MKRSPISRRTPLKSKKGIRSRSPIKKRTTGRTGPHKRRKKSDLARAKDKLWQLCRTIIIQRHGTDCYTCPARNLSGSNLHIGHFIPSSVCSAEMRYDLDNLRPQCYRDNIHKSGNWPAYKEHLIADGLDPDELEQRNRDTIGAKYDILWYEAKIQEYEVLVR